MLRVFYFIISCFFIAPAWTQNLSLFEGIKDFDWEAISNQRIKNSHLERVFEVSKGMPYDYLYFLKEQKDQYHLVDLDGNGQNEVIYNGWDGNEAHLTAIFKELEDKSFELLQKFTGKIVHAESSNSGFEIMSLDQTGCNGQIEHLQKWKFDSSQNKFVLKQSIAKHKSSELPEKWIKPIKISLKTNEPKMYKSYLKGETEKNRVGLYKNFNKGVAYGVMKDVSGSSWWFIIMKNSPVKGKHKFCKGSNPLKRYYTLGWIPAADVEIQ